MRAGLRRATFVSATLLTILPACRARAGEVGPEECQPTGETLPSGATADGIAGEYRLTLVTDSAQQVRVASGKLWLEPYRGRLRQRVRPDGSPDSSTVYAAFGGTDIDLAAVGALQIGSTTSRDSTRPGVLLMERHTARGEERVTQLTFRLGSTANRRDQTRFDGGYTALYVRAISDEGLAGDWASGAGSSQTRGHFCATRKEGR